MATKHYCVAITLDSFRLLLAEPDQIRKEIIEQQAGEAVFSTHYTSALSHILCGDPWGDKSVFGRALFGNAPLGSHQDEVLVNHLVQDEVKEVAAALADIDVGEAIDRWEPLDIEEPEEYQPAPEDTDIETLANDLKRLIEFYQDAANHDWIVFAYQS